MICHGAIVFGAWGELRSLENLTCECGSYSKHDVAEYRGISTLRYLDWRRIIVRYFLILYSLYCTPWAQYVAII